MKFHGFIFFLVFFSICCVFYGLEKNKTSSKVQLISSDMLKEVLSGKKFQMEFLNDPLPHVKVVDEKHPEKPIGYLFNSGDLSLSAKGYAGEIDCNVLVGPDGSVMAVIVGDNKETPKYLKRVLSGKFLQNWKGKKYNDQPPETVSGATRTSEAINKSVKAVLEKLDSLNFFK